MGVQCLKDSRNSFESQKSFFVKEIKALVILTSFNQKHLVEGIKQACDAKKMVPLVKKCQSVYSMTLYYLFSVNYDLCDLGVQYVLAGIFDKCLKAMAHRSNKPKKTVDFVIKKAEVLIPYVIKKQNEFQHYANG